MNRGVYRHITGIVATGFNSAIGRVMQPSVCCMGARSIIDLRKQATPYMFGHSIGQYSIGVALALAKLRVGTCSAMGIQGGWSQGHHGCWTLDVGGGTIKAWKSNATTPIIMCHCELLAWPPSPFTCP